MAKHKAKSSTPGAAHDDGPSLHPAFLQVGIPPLPQSYTGYRKTPEHEMLEEATYLHWCGLDDEKWGLIHSLARRVTRQHEREHERKKGGRLG